MLIVGEWRTGDDGIARPAIAARVRDLEGAFLAEAFLIDSCADRTVFSANLLARLRFPAKEAAGVLALQGIGGATGFSRVQTVLELTRDDGVPIHLRGEYAAFTDPAATDLSILGRDVLNLFDIIISRRRDEVLLLAPNHRYRVERA